MNSLSTWLLQCFTDPLAAARAAVAPVGIVGFDFPLDISACPERVFCHLPCQTGRNTPQAEAWLEPAFPGWARSMLQDWSEGRFDMFDSVVFTRGDDAAQRLYYYVCELQRRGMLSGPRPLILDVAAIPRAGSVQHNMHALRTLMTELELDMDCVHAGVTRANRQRQLFARLEHERSGPGHLYENMTRAALFDDPLPALEHIRLMPIAVPLRLYLAGSVPPDDTLHRAAEGQGWNIVGEMHACSPQRHGGPVLAGDDPLLAMATRLNGNVHGPRSFVDRATMLRAELERTGAGAVVFWLTREDEGRAWDLAGQRDVCALAGKPSLVLTQADWEFRDGAADKLARFLKDLHV